MRKLCQLEDPSIAEDAAHQQGVLRYLPGVCEQAVHALLAQLLRELLGIWRSAACTTQRLCRRSSHKVFSRESSASQNSTHSETMLSRQSYCCLRCCEAS